MKKNHPIFSDADFSNLNPAKKAEVLKYFKSKKFTPDQYVDLLAGNYHDDENDAHVSFHESDFINALKILKNHPHNTIQNNDHVANSVEDQLKNDDDYWKSAHAKAILEHLPLSSDRLQESINNHKESGDLLHSVIDNPSITKDHLSSLVDNDVMNSNDLIKHPLMDQQLFDKLAENRDHDTDKVYGDMDKFMTPDHAEKFIKNSKKIRNIDDMLKHLPEDKRHKVIQDTLGMTGGSHSEELEDFRDPKDFGWDNWDHGPDRKRKMAADLAGSKYLNPQEIDHIKRHGDFDDKYALFNNEHIAPKHHLEMMQKWSDDDSHHGYEESDLKDKLRDEHSDSKWDDYGEEARHDVGEAYPMSEYIRDHINDDAFMDDKSEDDWKEEYLGNEYNWDHTPEPTEENPEPDEEDFSRDMESHPEYHAREKEAQKAYDKELERAKDHAYEDDGIQNGYDEYLNDSINQSVEDKFNNAIDNWAEGDENLLPRHVIKAMESPWAEDQDLTPENLKEGLDHPLKRIQLKAVNHPKMTPELLSEVLKGDHDPEVKKAALQHPNIGQQQLQEAIDSDDSSIAIQALKNPSVTADMVHKALKHDDPKVQKKAQDLADRHFPAPTDQLNVSTGTHPLRILRDFIDQHGGKISKSKLKQLGANPAPIDKLFSPQGVVSSKDVQDYIDQVPAATFNSSEGKPWDGGQQHSKEPSKVVQINYTQDHLDKMKAAGVDQTFKNLYELNHNSGHPVRANTLGWIRYTGEPETGFHIDEIQTDFGQSMIKRQAAMAKEAFRRGEVSLDQVEQNNKNAEEQFPEEHMNKITEILFGKKHPSEVLHEGFKEFMRQKGFGNTPIEIWKPKGKAPLSGQTTTTQLSSKEANQAIDEAKSGNLSKDNRALIAWGQKAKVLPASHKEIKPEHLEALKTHYENHVNAFQADPSNSNELLPTLEVPLPVHMQEGYGNIPKKMGYQDSAYGTLPTQENKELINQPTSKELIRKSEKLASDIQQKIGMTLSSIDQNKDTLEQIKQSNPQAYQAIMELVQTMIDLVKQTTGQDPTAMMHKDQIQGQLEQGQEQQQGQQETQEQAPPGLGRASTADEELHNRKQVYAPGSIRRDTSQDARIKDTDGNWNAFKGGLQAPAEGQQSE